jgi:type II secretory pathway pseudopilin PulG
MLHALRSRLRRDERGFTIVETLVAIIILITGVIGSVTLMNAAGSTTLSNNERETAINLSRELIEAADGLSYAQTAPTTIVAAIQAQAGLGDASTASGWQIVRRNVTFTVAMSSCTFDDSKDGAGSHSVAADQPWCSDSASGASTDANANDYRRVSVDASWAIRTRTATVHQATLITNRRPSAAIVPNARTVDIASCTPAASCNSTALSNDEVSYCYLFQTSPGCAASATSCPTTSNSTCANAVNFTVTTIGSPASVKWAVDGVVQGNASGSGNSWTFTWNLATNYPQTTVDGTYDVSAQAYDSAGAASGDSAVDSVKLNRFTPDVTAFVTIAGLNPLWSSVPEIEFYPSNTTGARVDRDIAGYTYGRFYGRNSGTPTADYAGTCFNIAANWCRDTTYSNISGNPTTWVEYELVPDDLAPDGEVRWAANYVTCSNSFVGATCSRSVMAANTQPTAPTSLTASASGGNVTLNWTVPNSNGGAGDPDSNDCVDTFRIYRTPTSAASPAITDRYDRTPSGVISAACGTIASSSYTDTATGGVQHKYWVTSVDTRLAESTLLGPVTQ